MKTILPISSLKTDDSKLDVQQIIEENGFKFEQHDVTTEDGYILTMQRIPGKQGAPVVLLEHGIEDASIEFVINSPDKAIAFILARQGYDVWLGNNRGNYYSHKHVKYTTNEKQFWDFDFEEMGLMDVPAMADFIKKQTKKSKISYLGHSEGTT